MFVHPKQRPANGDHENIRGIHLHDVITHTAMEREANCQLGIVSWEKQSTVVIRLANSQWRLHYGTT